MKTFIVLAVCVACAFADYRDQPLGQESKFRGRIVGGIEVDIAGFPYQLSMRLNDDHWCGASIISSNWAMSAAHCTYPAPPVSSMTFRAGSSSRTTGGTIFQAAEIVNHPLYDPVTIDNDVCVIRITTSFVGTDIVPITIVPIGTSFPHGTRSVVSGWGMTTPGGPLPVYLHAVNIPVVGQDACRGLWGAQRITENMICAGEFGRDACNHDSGSPLVTGGRQFGIVSWGTSQCGEQVGVYVNIGAASIRNFINSTTGV
ncbi:trypsin-7-like [Sabethes cyaneus]|uniref:trypsin-7-like n=1 Tax=Sabethes cyaneus TaxID=53552 RepID=UPI00237D78FB|nr:trypsin-7-like [Sabethes cyaneus]